MNVPPALILDRVTKRFENGVVALQDVNLKVAQSEFVSLVGPSGCGKSTLLRIVAGLRSLSAGQVEWVDRQLKKQIAFVFQEPALMPWATVQDNVRLPLKLSGIGRREANKLVTSVLQLVGLENFAQSYPRQLSGGMKMRVSIARALVTSPQMLLMDEPFGALDDITRTSLNDELLNFWSQEKWTVMFVTHNIYEAVYLSSRVVIMAARPGRIVAEVAIDQPYPRQPEFRTSQAFSHYCQQVSAQLAQAMMT
ncbi:Taurine-transporting ATPase [Thalassoporum mexicanum PCC 7367]|uniref:ABC transporter ATP-binding protein n=1 Tax=Thalassoporum mexicanum TaxID=3457544 RepID=UPI00029FB9D6|nr:ABC transporter ATP-binding protein [Pseudanabaena sp. PCC 7367]AFY71402.1 Taurine-transporting ATPase [Pseudanabaena sp. PCC 7367]